MRSQFFLPLITYPDQTPEVMIGNAVDLARNCAALIHAATFEVNIPPITDPWASLLVDVDKMTGEAEGMSNRNAERLGHAFEQRAVAAGIEPDCEALSASQPDMIEVVAEVARHYDLTLLHAAPQFESLAQAVLFGSGRPIILFPDEAFASRIDHVAIAWDGSRAAARALADAIPFVGVASQVSIIYAMDEKPLDDDPGRRLFDSLAAAGVKVEAYPFNLHGRPIGDALQFKAIEIRADLLVMGGYGHSRMREFILGGATAGVLANTHIPVLMSH